MNTPSFDIEQTFRKLAKSEYWQSIFSLSKVIKLQLFENNTDLTSAQILFIYFLSYYSSLKLDISLGDVNPLVLSNTVFEDSYMYYKSKENTKSEKSEFWKNELPKKDKSTSVNTSQWIFKRQK